MASIPSSGSLMATHNYRRRRLSSTSSNSSCGSSEYSGEVIPHPPGLPKSDPGHWWASFFFGKTTHPAMTTHPTMTTVSESPESLGALRVTAGPMACGLVPAPGAGRRRHASEPSSGPSA
ncbi:PDPFB factor, partial [Cepphus grylle]|nr:PDPFB factor [Cepphus grylle]